MNASLPDIRRTLETLFHPGAVIEMRVPNVGRLQTVSGYYDDLEKLASDAAKWSGKAEGVYVTLNQVRSDLLARAVNRCVTCAKRTTRDEHIDGRHWLFFDFDAVRPAGISANDEERAIALERASSACALLRDLGFAEPAVADSGNGAHLLYRIDLPNVQESTTLIERCTKALAFRFDDEHVKLDPSTFNASRIIKLYGTLAAKGDSTPERPHRLARLVEVPIELEINHREVLEGLAAMLPDPQKPKGLPNASDIQFDVDAFLARHSLETLNEGSWNGGYKWPLRVCPFNHEHRRGEAYILRFTDGAIVAGCLHQSCKRVSGKAWRELRAMYEPRTRELHKTEMMPDTEDEEAQPLLRSFANFMSQQFEACEQIAFELQRREIGLVASVTNAGKSTLLRNALLALATGGEFAPLVEKGTPRRVGLLDFETSAARLQHDLRRMTRDWPNRERKLLDENFFIICEGMIGDDLLSLSLHLSLIEREARARRLDFIVVDTAGAAFDIWNENDNGEIARRVAKPLLKLARKLDCPILTAHHVGKPKSEEGSNATKIHRPRGASAFTGYVASAYILESDASDPDAVTLTCAKRKSGAIYEVRMKLDRETRWFNQIGEATRALTNYELVVKVVRESDDLMKRAAIDEALNGQVKKATITRCLKDAVARGDLFKGSHGLYGDGKYSNAQAYSDEHLSISEDSAESDEIYIAAGLSDEEYERQHGERQKTQAEISQAL